MSDRSVKASRQNILTKLYISAIVCNSYSASAILSQDL